MEVAPSELGETLVSGFPFFFVGNGWMGGAEGASLCCVEASTRGSYP